MQRGYMDLPCGCRAFVRPDNDGAPDVRRTYLCGRDRCLDRIERDLRAAARQRGERWRQTLARVPVATAVATSRVTGANRTANARPNNPVCIATSLRSTAGPTTRNTSRGTNGTIVRLAATNASASEHSDNTNASTAMLMTPRKRCPAMCSNTHGGNIAWSSAAAAAPTTR